MHCVRLASQLEVPHDHGVQKHVRSCMLHLVVQAGPMLEQELQVHFKQTLGILLP